MADERFAFVVVSNRLPVDRVVAEDGSAAWKQSPGGLVTALEPVMRGADGAWVGWIGQPGGDLDPFTHDGIRIVPVALSDYEIENYYEGFSNDTIWPLYHDVIAPPRYHREWWEQLRRRKPAVCRCDGRHRRARRHRVGAGLPAATRAPHAAAGPTRPCDRVLQPHPVSCLRVVLATAVAHPDHRGPARRRRCRLSARLGCRQLLPRGAAVARVPNEEPLRLRAGCGRASCPAGGHPSVSDFDRRRRL